MKKKIKDSIVVIDTCGYSKQDNGTCMITGWLYFAKEEEEPYVQVRAGHLPMECTMVRVRRPDVLDVRTDLDFKTENVGYEIRIPNMESLFETSDYLRVRICCGGKCYPILQKSIKEIKEEYLSDTIRFYIDRMERRMDKVHIEGWCINTGGELKMKILDDHGDVQKDVHLVSVRRPDLREHFGVSLDQCHGFQLDIPRNSITAKGLHIVFSDSLTSKETVVNMAEFDRENTRLGRMRRLMGRGNFAANKEMIKNQGIRAFVDYVKENSCAFTDYYGYYEKKHAATPKELKAQAAVTFCPSVKFSIVVPLYNTPISFFKELIDSVIAQSYGNWQLCLADGSDNIRLQQYIQENYAKEKRICYKQLEENKGISENTNAAIAMAEGDYIVFADHDDMLAPDALYHAACTLRDYPDGDLVYSDEDVIDVDGNYIYPHFKPDFNLYYLRCINYICHLVVVRKSLLEEIGGLDPACDGAQDHDFLLKVTEKTSHIYHIPRVLYHWRSHEGSTAGNQESKLYAVDAGKRALQEHIARMGIRAEVEFSGEFVLYNMKYLPEGNPKISILIPNKDHVEDLKKCIDSIEEKSTWKNYEIIIIENNSEEEETFAFYEKLEQQYANIKTVKYEGGFNYSAINNFGARFAQGEYLLLLNNDTEVITPDWLEQMLGCCQREDTAIAGAKLYYPDKTVQHAGIVIGMGGFAGHILTGYGNTQTGYMGRLKAIQEVSAVTGACLMVKKSVFEKLNGLNEGLAVALNDVDFCLRARELNKKVVFLPGVELFHYESKSRGFETTPEKKERFQKEIRRFQERHSRILEEGDPYYNPNLTLVKGDCSLRKDNEPVKEKKEDSNPRIIEVEQERFFLNDTTRYVIQGIIPEKYTVEAYLDGTPLECMTNAVEARSAMERFRDSELPGSKRVESIIHLPENLEDFRKLDVYAVFKGKKSALFHISVKELLKRRGKIQYYIEEEHVDPRNHSLILCGWAAAEKPVRMKLLDENKEKIPVVFQRNTRIDIQNRFRECQVDKDCGFYAEVKNIQGRFCYLVIYASDGSKAVHKINLGTGGILMGKAGKYQRKAVNYFHSYGMAALMKKAVHELAAIKERPMEYSKWLPKHLPTAAELEKQKKAEFDFMPKISIVVPLYKTKEKYLLKLVDSVREQSYKNWELCLSDGSGKDSSLAEILQKLTKEDDRIKVISHNTMLRIAENTNEACRMASGDFVAFADHDDMLTPDALFACVKALNEYPDTEVLYSDEDKMSMDGSKFFQPHFKPDFNPDLLCTVNYICHLLVVKKELLEKVGFLRPEYDGAQDYDLIFRCVETTEQITHIPRILYHWRCHEDSTAENPESKSYAFDAGRRAVQAHFDRIGIKAEVYHGEYPGLYRTRYIREHDPLISIIIPNKDHIDDLERCISSVEKKSSYRNFEYIIVENNSMKQETFAYYKELEKKNPKVHVVCWNDTFNYSAINNFGASHARGEYLLLLNNDTEVINEDWLEEMLGYCMRPDVGAVGARLYYDDNTIQHAGVVLGFGGIAGHCFVKQPRGFTGYCHRIICAQDYSAVTAACMMVKRTVFEQVKGLSEDLAVAFNDVDFCLKIRDAGYLVVYNPYAELYHYESKSRGLEDTPEKRERFLKEIETIEAHWPDRFKKPDPYYNPNLTLKSQDFSLKRI